MSVVKLFSNRYVYSFRPFLAKLGAHNLCANNENHGTYFRNFDFKIFGDFFFNFSVWPTLQQRTVGLDSSADVA